MGIHLKDGSPLVQKSQLQKFVFGGLLAVVINAAPAQAGATRTWVSGVGDDLNPCSRTAPCKTFAGAISKTAPGGEISVLDAGAFGTVTIVQAVTINGEGNLAGILASIGNGIIVNAGASDRVIIRNLQINGAGGGTKGITVLGGNVTIDNCLIYGFTAGGTGIHVSAGSAAHIDIRDTSVTNSTNAVTAQASGGGAAVMSIDNMRINDAGTGVGALSDNVFMVIRNSFIGYTGAAGILTSGGAASISLDHSELTHNIIAVNATGAGSTVRLNDVSIYENNTGLAISNGATIATAGNNKIAGSPGAATNGTVSNF
jgi:hypothetical protein